MSKPPLVALKARYVFTGHGPPLRDAILTYGENGVVSVGDTSACGEVQDLGNAAIVPCLRNAHTHLELSHFDAPIGDPGQGFPAWIRDVVMWRREQFERMTEDERWEQRRAAVDRGYRECEAAGVTSVADIVSPGWTWELVPKGNVRVMPFHEVLGLRTNRADELFETAQQFVSEESFRGISPHAPYTVGIELLERLVVSSKSFKAPLAMHLAESPDELELLQSHSGAFYSLLTELDAWDPSAFPRGIKPLDYLRVLSRAGGALVIHGNYLDSEEIDFLAANSQRMTVVYCPRTHAYFGHPRYPLVEMLERGVRVALGTDSRASNPDLNLWNELRYVADTFPELSLETIFGLALHKEHPRFSSGSHSSFAIVELPNEDAADPYELLFDARSQVRSLWRTFTPQSE